MQPKQPDVSRIAEVISLLERYALGEVDLPRERVMALLAILNWAIPDARPEDGAADNQAVLTFH